MMLVSWPKSIFSLCMIVYADTAVCATLLSKNMPNSPLLELAHQQALANLRGSVKSFPQEPMMSLQELASYAKSRHRGCQGMPGHARGSNLLLTNQ